MVKSEFFIKFKRMQIIKDGELASRFLWCVIIYPSPPLPCLIQSKLQLVPSPLLRLRINAET